MVPLYITGGRLQSGAWGGGHLPRRTTTQNKHTSHIPSRCSMGQTPHSRSSFSRRAISGTQAIVFLLRFCGQRAGQRLHSSHAASLIRLLQREKNSEINWAEMTGTETTQHTGRAGSLHRGFEAMKSKNNSEMCIFHDLLR